VNCFSPVTNQPHADPWPTAVCSREGGRRGVGQSQRDGRWLREFFFGAQGLYC